MITVRRAVSEDRHRMLEISAQIWDGEDYVPELLEDWLADREGELAVALLDDHLIAFAHRTWLLPTVAWLEGIRTDPAFEGRGAAKAITEHFIRGARGEGATHVELSTYIENEASIHIIESYGFYKVATFSYLERAAELSAPAEAADETSIRTLSEEETADFAGSSEFLTLAHGRFPRGWKFFPYDHDPREAVARLSTRLGLEENGTLKAVICLRQSPDDAGNVTLNFLDGEPSAMRRLLWYSLHRYANRLMAVMVPVDEGRYAAALGLLREAGFTSWSGFKPDVFAYEMTL